MNIVTTVLNACRAVLVVMRGRRRLLLLLLALDEAAHTAGIHVDVKTAATGAAVTADAARHGRWRLVVIMIVRSTVTRMGMRLLLLMILSVLMRHVWKII